jgi:hypothetical protein
MPREIEIHNLVEQKIIEAFSISEGGQLKRKTIIKIVQKSVNKNESSIAKYIEDMAKEPKNYLIHSQHGIYKKNPDIMFRFIKMPTSKEKGPIEPNNEDRKAHTIDLKIAIQNWIDKFPDPNYNYPLDNNDHYSHEIAVCEDHILFPDLIYHLPALGSEICGNWKDYKRELIELDRLKKGLFSSLEDELLQCFEGLPLVFIFKEEHYSHSNYECLLTPLSLYNAIISLWSSDIEDNYWEFFSFVKDSSPIIEEKEYIQWGVLNTYLQVPKNDRHLLEAGVGRFISLFEDYFGSQTTNKTKEIVSKVDLLKKKRGELIRELERIKLYANFPGECEYLG